MTIGRRELLKGMGTLAASATLGRAGAQESLAALGALSPSAELPRKQDFDLTDGFTFLNAAYTHPIPRPSANAVREYLDQRNKLRQPPPGSGGGSGQGPSAKALFAELINANPTEIAYVPN